MSALVSKNSFNIRNLTVHTDLSVGSTLCIISAGLWIVGASFFIWAMHDLVEYVEDDYY